LVDKLKDSATGGKTIIRALMRRAGSSPEFLVNFGSSWVTSLVGRVKTSSSAVAKRPRDASCVLASIVQYLERSIYYY